uniref:Uncharacterized protein n=1 Tax=viral metagenome TaxID=1070528 RepID=A0A6H1ZKJ6_9ZZZZ
MNKSKREVYITLANEVDSQLCTFCTYFRGGCGCSACHHPLSAVEDIAVHIGPSDDCWAFSPCEPLDIIHYY